MPDSSSLPSPQQREVSFEIDPLTGFMTYDRFDAFSASKKVEFLRHYRQSLNMTQASELIGSNRMTVMEHIGKDRAFAKAVAQAKMAIADDLVHVAQRVAKKDEGVRDRWSLIERLNPDEYGRRDQGGAANVTINIDGKSLEHFSIKQQAIDAEIVPDHSPFDGTQG